MSKKEMIEATTEMQETEVIEEAAEEVIERPYELRKLKDRDLYPVLKIISRVFPDELAPIFLQLATGQKKLEEIGVLVATRLVIAIMGNMGKVKDDLYEFLSDLSGIPAEEIQEMEFGTTPMMIMDVVKDAKNVGFFKVLSKLF